MDKLMSILKEIRPDVDFEAEKRLIDDAVLDSFDIVSLIGELNDAYEIEIEFEDLEPENFNSAQEIYDFIQRMCKGK